MFYVGSISRYIWESFKQISVIVFLLEKFFHYVANSNKVTVT